MNTTLFAEATPLTRPQGVRTLGLGSLAVAAYLAVNGLLVMLGRVSFSSGAYLLGDLAIMGSLIYFIVAAAMAALGYGLLRGWRWTRRLAQVAAALLISGTVVSISSAVMYSQVFGIILHGAKIVLAIVIIRYLMQPEVVEWFGRPRSSESGAPA